MIVLDISLPGMSGLEVLGRVKACQPDQCVVILSMYAKPHCIRTVLNAGAAASLTKQTAPDEQVAASQAAHRPDLPGRRSRIAFEIKPKSRFV